MSELSTHLYRDKKEDDYLERILEPWGLWRSIGAEVLFSPRKSPIEGYNSVETALTDQLDRAKSKTLSKAAYREWRTRINALPVPKDTISPSPKTPNYSGHKFYTKINKILSEMNESYFIILIHRYEDGWEAVDFTHNYGKDLNYIWVNMNRARKSAKKILRENGIKV